MMRILTFLQLLFVLFFSLSASSYADEKRLEVLPVFFVPKDNAKAMEERINEYSKLLISHLSIAQQYYRHLLETDTFKIAQNSSRSYFSQNPSSFYSDQAASGPDTAHLIMKELFNWNHDNRNGSPYIYLVIYARPEQDRLGPFLGGGRTFNGMPNSGGGIVQLELSSLLSDEPYPFLSTLVHELGHAFGLTHVDCYGYSMSENSSLMSYNPDHHSKGINQGSTPGDFNPEEYYVLSQNKLAFPNFRYIEAKHSRQGKLRAKIENCYLGPMSSYIGELRQIPDKGYALYFDGKLVSGAEAQFFSRKMADDNCRWNKTTKNNIKVECRYDGKVINSN